MGERKPNVPDYDDDQEDGKHIVDEGGTYAHTYGQEVAPPEDQARGEQDDEEASDGIGVEFLAGVEFSDRFFSPVAQAFQPGDFTSSEPAHLGQVSPQVRAPTPDYSHQYRNEKGEPDVYVGVLYEKAAPDGHAERRYVQDGTGGRQCQDQQSRRPMHGPFRTVEPGHPLRPDYTAAATWLCLWPRVTR
jgi:hypothetical protein